MYTDTYIVIHIHIFKYMSNLILKLEIAIKSNYI